VYPARGLLTCLLACACLPSTAQAAQSARLHVSFTPERLGQSTTINIGIAITGPAESVPSPLTKLDVTYPGALGVDVSGLGLATCSQTRLESLGLEGCPADSRMGHGTALAEIAIGPEIEQEAAEVTILRAPQEGQIALLFYANAKTPVSAPLIFPGLLLPGPGNNESIQINVPLVPSLPGAPDIAVTRLHATLGRQGLTYYEHIHGRFVAYHPQGILLPHKCPHGGFPFTASFSFLDGINTSAYSTVPCPPQNKRS
jgi:hypothetical protein